MGKKIYAIALVCAIFGTTVLLFYEKPLYALFFGFTIPVLIKKLKEEHNNDTGN